MDSFWKKYHFSGAQLEMRGGGETPYPFLKIKKSALILEKKAVIVFILGLNFPFEMWF